jgi:PleD family two-component response regulator
MFLLPDTGLEGASVFAERVRAGLEGKTYACDLFELNVTMTFGVAQYDKDQGGPGTIGRADMGLLRGKNSGRNQVVVFRDADR